MADSIQWLYVGPVIALTVLQIVALRSHRVQRRLPQIHEELRARA